MSPDCGATLEAVASGGDGQDQARPGHVLLAGFMGTGKTSVGQVLAARLSLPFVDLDRLISDDAGLSIAEIFANEGEAGFRSREARAVARLAGLPRSVVALGGWTIGDQRSRATLDEIGQLICLTAEPETLAGRLASLLMSRPKLSSTTADSVRSLLEPRLATYASVALQVRTDNRNIEEVADIVLGLIRATEGRVRCCLPVGGSTPPARVIIGPGVIESSPALMSGLRSSGSQIVVISDRTVDEIGILSPIVQALKDAKFSVSVATVASGESAKRLASVEALGRQMVEFGAERRTLTLAVGGGVVTDLAGFVAATFMRGIPWMAVPTTLVGMVDAAIGGKTAVNLPEAKNAIGAFWPPEAVFVDPLLVASMPGSLIRQGLAEIVKAAVLADASLFGQLAQTGAPRPDDHAEWTEIIHRAVRVKIGHVAADPRDEGARLALNLGHTFAHGFEAASGYALAHGDAVAVGLMAAARLAVELGIAVPGLEDEIEAALERLGLPVRLEGLDADAIEQAMKGDKKREGGQLRFVVPRGIGGGVEVVSDVPEKARRRVLRSVLDG